jgi:hypothetical protein
VKWRMLRCAADVARAGKACNAEPSCKGMAWMSTGCCCAAQDKVKITYRPVHDQPMDSEMEHIPPKARTY